ncbi:MAG: sialidase family protein, partial [Marinilabiliaceae bacterium]|nr:sialidase family protein [Marinilabiliaceae bacterium]
MKKISVLLLTILIILSACEKKSPEPGKYVIPNYRVSSYTNLSANEITIAINPLNTENIIAGSNLDYYYWSFTGATTWSERSLVSGLYGVWGDPVVIFDNNAYAYYSHLSNPEGPAWIDRIVVQRSINGGQTWDDGRGIGYNTPKVQDKEWLAVDNSDSQYSGNLYLSWTEFDVYGSNDPADKSRIRFSFSDDLSETWSEPITISDTEGDCQDDDNTMEGAVPAVGNNGEIYIAWAGPEGIYFDKSTDGGLSFGTDMVLAPMPGGWGFDVPEISRCNGMPFTVCDISDSEHSGNIYVLWSDQRNGLDNTDIFIIKSEDSGNTWTDPLKVNNDNTVSHQFFPNICVDPVTGIIYIVYYDRSTAAGVETDVFMARSDNGGD